MLEPAQRRVLRIAGSARRDAQCRDHAGQRGVHARLEHAEPEHGPDQHVRGDPHHAEPVQDQQRDDRETGKHQRRDGKVVRVEDGDDHDGAEIVEHGERHQEDLEPDRDPFAEERQHAEREGDVGRRGNRPAADAYRIIPVEPGIDGGRHDHAAERGDGRQRDLARVREFAHHGLALDLEAHQQEEDRHQQVVDPDAERLVERKLAELDLEVRLQQRLVSVRERRVRGDHRQHARHDEQDAARGLELEELAYRHEGTGLADLGLAHARICLRVGASSLTFPCGRPVRRTRRRPKSRRPVAAPRLRRRRSLQWSGRRPRQRPAGPEIPWTATKAPSMFWRRSSGRSPTCGRVSRERRTAPSQVRVPSTRATRLAISADWLKPRSAWRPGCRGTGTTQSTS